LPETEESVDENGVTTIIEYSVNDEGKKVKVRGLLISTFSYLHPHADYSAYPENDSENGSTACCSAEESMVQVWTGKR
jgi:hypothetical protein